MSLRNNVLAVTVLCVLSRMTFGQQVAMHAPAGSALQKRISDAKDRHEATVDTPRLGFTARLPARLDEVLKESVVVIAKYERRTSAPEEYGIVTYERFLIVQQFVIRKRSAIDQEEKRPLALPLGVAPAARSELILNHLGGTAVVDGVTVNTPNSYPTFVQGQTYCLFVQPSPGVEGYGLYFGEDAVYRIQGGNLIPANPAADNVIAADLRAKVKGKLAPLRAHIISVSRGEHQ